MAEIQDLSGTDASNTGRWPENMTFSSVNDAGRADEGLLARWYKDTDFSITAGGSSNAFTVTTNRTIAALFNNMTLAFTANHSITGTATLNVNGLGAKTIKRFNGDPLASGDIISGQPVIVVYKSASTEFFMLSALAALTDNTFVDMSENASPGTPAADTARLHAKDDSGGTTRVYYIDAAGTTRLLLTGASSADMEAQLANRGVTPDVQHRHPGHPKAGGLFDGTGTPAFASGDYGMGAITDNGTGDYTLAYDTAFSSTSYWLASHAKTPGAFFVWVNETGTRTTSSIRVAVGNTTANQDSAAVGITSWGDYA